MARWRPAWLAIVTAVLLGCSDSAGPGSTSTDGGTDGSAVTTGPTSPQGGRVQGPPQALYQPRGGGLKEWASPTGNIVCIGWLLEPSTAESVAASGETAPAPETESPLVGCRIEEGEWSIPEPASERPCEQAWVDEIWLGDSARGGTCRGDVGILPAGWTLQYGQEVRIGEVVCHSLRTGMFCLNTQTGSGFRIARDSYDLFN